MTKTKSKILSVFLAIVMTLTMNIGILAGTTNNVNAASYNFTRTHIRGGGDISSKFKINGMTGICQHGGPNSVGSGKATMSKLGQSNIKTKLVYYYGEKKGWTSGSNGCKLARALYYSWSGVAYHQSASTLKNMVNTAKKQSVPDNFSAYICYPTNKSQSFVAWKMTPGGYVKVYKRTTNNNSKKSSQYSFKDAEFKVYKSNKKTVVDTLKTNAKGNTPKSKSLAPGTYYIKEVKAPKGYNLNNLWYKVKIKSGGTKGITIKNKPKEIGINIKKVLTAGSEGTVKGFNFTIKNTETKQTYSRATDDHGDIQIKGLIAGKYEIKEVLTAAQVKDGYIIKTKNPQTITVAPGKTGAVTFSNERTLDQRIAILKTTTDDGPIEGFVFNVKGPNLDKNYATNENGRIDIQDAKPGEYTVTEVMTPEQVKRYHQPEPQTLTLEKGSNASIVFNFENKSREYPVKLKKTSNDGAIQGITFNISGKTAFGDEVDITKQTDKDGNIDFGEIAPGEYIVEETGFDDEKYDNLYPMEGKENPAQKLVIPETTEEGKEFTVSFENVRKSYLVMSKVDQATDNFLPGAQFEIKNSKGDSIAVIEITRDENKKPTIKVIKGDKNLTGMAEDDIAEDFDDGQAVVFEDPADTNTLSTNGLSVDPNLSMQNTATGSHLFATNDIDGDGKIESGENENEKSEVNFNIKYNANGVYDEDGNAVESEKGTGEDKTQTIKEGDVAKIYSFESAGFTAPKFYVFDSWNTEPDGSGDSFEAEDNVSTLEAEEGDTITLYAQYVEDEENHATQVNTQLDNAIIEEGNYDDGSGGNSEFIEGDEVAIGEQNTEGVDYEFGVLKGLKIGEEYTITEIKAPVGYLPLKDPIKLNFNGTAILAVKDKMPNIGTKAIDSDTKDHISNPDAKVKIWDEVSYINLNPGEEYTVQGTLVDKKTEKVVKDDNGKPVKSEKVTFTAPSSEGRIKVPFTLSAKHLAGKTTVVFEEMYYDGQLIASHLESGSKEQTIHFPKIGTKANLGDNKNVKDVVSYKNLIPGKTYTMKGWLVDKNGNKVPNSDSMQEFKPKKPSGKIIMRLNGKSAKGKTVVFEECRLKGKLVGSHKNLKDKHQTVNIDSPTPTGDNTMWWILGVIAALIIIAGGTIVYKRRKSC